MNEGKKTELNICGVKITIQTEDGFYDNDYAIKNPKSDELHSGYVDGVLYQGDELHKKLAIKDLEKRTQQNSYLS